MHPRSSCFQIGSPPDAPRFSSTKDTITSVGGRVPPGQKIWTPCGGYRWPAGANGPRAPAPSSSRGPASFNGAVHRYPARPAEPTPESSRPYSQPAPRSTGSPPTASHAPPRDRIPAAPLSPSHPGSTPSSCSWPHSLGPFLDGPTRTRIPPKWCILRHAPRTGSDHSPFAVASFRGHSE